MFDDDTAERLKELRSAADGEDIDEIVRWQMTGYLLKQAPTRRKASIPRCHNCGLEWHGLKKDGCPGSFIDTPETH